MAQMSCAIELLSAALALRCRQSASCTRHDPSPTYPPPTHPYVRPALPPPHPTPPPTCAPEQDNDLTQLLAQSELKRRRQEAVKITVRSEGYLVGVLPTLGAVRSAASNSAALVEADDTVMYSEPQLENMFPLPYKVQGVQGRARVVGNTPPHPAANLSN
jgi:hypothetical protein